MANNPCLLSLIPGDIQSSKLLTTVSNTSSFVLKFITIDNGTASYDGFNGGNELRNGGYLMRTNLNLIVVSQ